MDDGSGRAALYALEAIVGGLRDAGVLTPAAIQAIERRTTMALDLAGAIDFKSAGFALTEPHAIRQGAWCAREFIAPSGGTVVDVLSGHPTQPQRWPTLEERLAAAARDFEEPDDRH